MTAAHYLRHIARLTLAMGVAAFLTACTRAALTVANVAGSFGDYERIEALPYGAGSHQTLDVFVPGGDGNARPVVVFWYGGGFTQGSPSQFRFVGSALAEAGFVAMLPDYRQYPEVVFPAFIDDGAAALAWVRGHAAEFGGDPQEIFLMGHSAGAHIAAMVAVEHPEDVRGLIGLSGPYVLTPNDPTLLTIFAAPYTPADWQPVQHVTSKSPPALLIHGAADTVVWPSHSEKFAAALRSAGVPVQLYIYPGRAHADTVAALSIPARGRAPVLAQAIEFIRSETRQSP